MSKQYKVGFDVLGPVFRFFCFRLRLIETYKSQTPLLFLSRGGLRLRYFYETYLASNHLPEIAPRGDFYISRIAAFRALLARKSQYAAEMVASEYRGMSTRSALRLFLSAQGNLDDAEELAIPEKLLDGPVSAESLVAIISTLERSEGNRDNFLAQQHDLLTTHFDELVGDQKEVVLVDTGWSGSIIRSLKELFPKHTFTAAFFGRYNYGKPAPEWFDAISGLVFQGEDFSITKPQTSLMFHRHLVENLCEPPWPSAERFEHKEGTVLPVGGPMPSKARKPQEYEEMARGVADFLATEITSNPEVLINEYRAAIKILSKLLVFPNRETAKLLGELDRPADFGREKPVPVLLDQSFGGSRMDRVRNSLWRQGQIAMEYGVFRYPLQLALIARRVSRRVAKRLLS